MKHLHLIAIILGAILAGSTLFWTASAQSSPVDYTLFVPDALKNDAINDQIMVLRGGANIKEAIKIVSSAGGFFAFQDPDNKTGLYFFHNNEPNEIEVYRYLPSEKEFGLMDCANIWGDTETPDVSTGIMVAHSSGFTVSDFLKYYDCKPVDAWYWSADDVPYAGEDLEPQAEAKKTHGQMKNAYGAEYRVDFSGTTTTSITTAAADKGTSASTTPSQQLLTISPGIAVVELVDNKAAMDTTWNSTTEKLGTTQYVFKVNGIERYILDIWHFKKIKDKDAYEIGARIYLVEKGKPVKTWEYATYTPALDTDGKDLGGPRQVIADSKTGILNITKNDPLPTIVFTTSTGTNKSRGDIIVHMQLKGNNIGIGIDVTEDAVFDERTVMRFRLSEETFLKIAALPEYKVYASDKSKLYMEGKLKFRFTSTGNPDIEALSNAIVLPSSTTPPVSADHYFRSDIATPVRPGKYTMKVNLEGYDEIEIQKIVNWDDLSTPVINTQLFVRELTINENFKKDYCTACNNLVSCLACVDNRIVTQYEK